jgi:hypothetical protein
LTPTFLTPDGRADLEHTTDDLIAYLKSNGVGLENIISAPEIAAKYDIKVWQAHTCAFQARVQLRLEDRNLCAKPGPGGGFFIAAGEEEARAYGVARSERTLTEIDTIVKDVETAIRGVVRSAPAGTEMYWKRTKRRLSDVAGELTKVRAELAVGAAAAAEIESGAGEGLASSGGGDSGT